MKRRDIRRFGPGPYLLGLKRVEGVPWGRGFPYDVLKDVEHMSLDQPVTLLVGDNGSGKSTFVEAFAESFGFDLKGGELERLGELPATPRHVVGEPYETKRLEPVINRWARPRTGYFLRAESFFNVAALVDQQGEFSPDLSLYGDVPLHKQSHGESFLALASHRFAGEGLYILDEPEAALSVSGNLALLTVIVRAAEAGAQFVIATHSPILLAIPSAKLYEFGDEGFAEVAYDDLDTVRPMRGFLDAPERYLRAALGD